MSNFMLEEQLFEIIKNKDMNEDLKLHKIDMLIKLGCNIEVKDECRCTPLMYASRYGYVKVAEKLIDNGAKLDEFRIVIPPKFGESRIGDLLLDNGYFDRLRYDTGKTALFDAVCYQHKDLVKLLLDRGANVNMIDENGCTPLIRASEAKSYDCASLLVEYGANVNSQGDDGQKALRLADKKMKEIILQAVKLRKEKDKKGFLGKVKDVFR